MTTLKRKNINPQVDVDEAFVQKYGAAWVLLAAEGSAYMALALKDDPRGRFFAAQSIALEQAALRHGKRTA